MQTPGSLCRVSSVTPRIAKLSPGCSFEGVLMMPSRVQLNATVTFDVKIPGDKEVCNITSDCNFLYNPTSVCIVDQGTVAMSTCSIFDKGCIVFVSVTDSMKYIRKIDVGKDSYGIDSYKQNLMVCADGNSILTYDASYKVSKRIPLSDSHVFKAICVSPDGQGIHYTVQDQIVIMDMNGEKLEIFKSDVLKGEVTITVDKNGIIYCCGQQSNNVVLSSPEGRQLCVLLSHEHGLKNPIGICLNDRNTKLLVFESKSSEIKAVCISNRVAHSDVLNVPSSE
ncbi:hypothetical protein CHS0354_002948 [Potamilus streckersoni]|uniref:Uncharacterized protein n=1 Tax=Potamilus streckersoni TaxID=2493646 RepID=A0AAE0RSC6_9BIVA|nr:hypothetical protein CHS0354_002948 [Potamilus streckersoni]